MSRIMLYKFTKFLYAFKMLNWFLVFSTANTEVAVDKATTSIDLCCEREDVQDDRVFEDVLQKKMQRYDSKTAMGNDSPSDKIIGDSSDPISSGTGDEKEPKRCVN